MTPEEVEDELSDNVLQLTLMYLLCKRLTELSLGLDEVDLTIASKAALKDEFGTCIITDGAMHKAIRLYTTVRDRVCANLKTSDWGRRHTKLLDLMEMAPIDTSITQVPRPAMGRPGLGQLSVSLRHVSSPRRPGSKVLILS